MAYIIVLVGVIVLLIFWLISFRNSIAVLDKNINNALSQIEVQLSSRWDALALLLDLTKGYMEQEYETLAKTIKARRAITKDSTPEDIDKQEKAIVQVLGKIMAVAENYPELKAEITYIRTMDAVNQYENMLRTSWLIYNESVKKLNRSIRIFPVSLVAAMLGFSKRTCFQVPEKNKISMSGGCIPAYKKIG